MTGEVNRRQYVLADTMYRHRIDGVPAGTVGSWLVACGRIITGPVSEWVRSNEDECKQCARRMRWSDERAHLSGR